MTVRVGYSQRMTMNTADTGETGYSAKLREVAAALRGWTGPVALVSHVDPDGDALGSTLALKRALDSLGFDTVLALDVPPYLQFLVGEDEVVPHLEGLADGTLLCILDVADLPRTAGLSQEALDSAAFTVNIDHHGTNDGFGDLALVEPGKAATCQIVKELIDELGVTWTRDIATPCLTGMITDTGSFRFSNTDASLLAAAADMLRHGVDYAALADRLQRRPRSYYQMMGAVLSTLTYPLDGLVAVAHLTPAMEAEVERDAGDSDDYVGLYRYAEGTKLAVFLKEREDHTKVSVRSRDGVSAQNVCRELGGGGHEAAAGAKLDADLAETRRRVLEAAQRELRRTGHLQ